jgi:CBS domain-containing protein
MNEQSPTPDPDFLRVTQVMRTVSTSVERRAHLAAARYLMRHCDERVIVVVDDEESQEPIGVITENDVDRALALGYDLNEVRVADISPKAPLSVESAASVRDAAMAMLCHGIRYLPVVDQGRLVGVVCLGDLRRQLPRDQVRPSGVTQPGASRSSPAVPAATAGQVSAERRHHRLPRRPFPRSPTPCR